MRTRQSTVMRTTISHRELIACTSSVAPSPGKFSLCEYMFGLGSALISAPFPLYLSFSLADLCYESLSHQGSVLFHQGEEGRLAFCLMPALHLPCMAYTLVIVCAPFTKK